MALGKAKLVEAVSLSLTLYSLSWIVLTGMRRVVSPKEVRIQSLFQCRHDGCGIPLFDADSPRWLPVQVPHDGTYLDYASIRFRDFVDSASDLGPLASWNNSNIEDFIREVVVSPVEMGFARLLPDGRIEDLPLYAIVSSSNSWDNVVDLCQRIFYSINLLCGMYLVWRFIKFTIKRICDLYLWVLFFYQGGRLSRAGPLTFSATSTKPVHSEKDDSGLTPKVVTLVEPDPISGKERKTTLLVRQVEGEMNFSFPENTSDKNVSAIATSIVRPIKESRNPNKPAIRWAPGRDKLPLGVIFQKDHGHGKLVPVGGFARYGDDLVTANHVAEELTKGQAIYLSKFDSDGRISPSSLLIKVELPMPKYFWASHELDYACYPISGVVWDKTGIPKGELAKEVVSGMNVCAFHIELSGDTVELYQSKCHIQDGANPWSRYHDGDTARGDCGFPVLFNSGKGKYRIVGIHKEGSLTRNPVRNGYVPCEWMQALHKYYSRLLKEGKKGIRPEDYPHANEKWEEDADADFWEVDDKNWNHGFEEPDYESDEYSRPGMARYSHRTGKYAVVSLGTLNARQAKANRAQFDDAPSQPDPRGKKFFPKNLMGAWADSDSDDEYVFDTGLKEGFDDYERKVSYTKDGKPYVNLNPVYAIPSKEWVDLYTTCGDIEELEQSFSIKIAFLLAKLLTIVRSDENRYWIDQPLHQFMAKKEGLGAVVWPLYEVEQPDRPSELVFVLDKTNYSRLCETLNSIWESEVTLPTPVLNHLNAIDDWMNKGCFMYKLEDKLSFHKKPLYTTLYGDDGKELVPVKEGGFSFVNDKRRGQVNFFTPPHMERSLMGMEDAISAKNFRPPPVEILPIKEGPKVIRKTWSPSHLQAREIGIGPKPIVAEVSDELAEKVCDTIETTMDVEKYDSLLQAFGRLGEIYQLKPKPDSFGRVQRVKIIREYEDAFGNTGRDVELSMMPWRGEYEASSFGEEAADLWRLCMQRILWQYELECRGLADYGGLRCLIRDTFRDPTPCSDACLLTDGDIETLAEFIKEARNRDMHLVAWFNDVFEYDERVRAKESKKLKKPKIIMQDLVPLGKDLILAKVEPSDTGFRGALKALGGTASKEGPKKAGEQPPKKKAKKVESEKSSVQTALAEKTPDSSPKSKASKRPLKPKPEKTPMSVKVPKQGAKVPQIEDAKDVYIADAYGTLLGHSALKEGKAVNSKARS